MTVDDEKDYIMRMIKEMVRVLSSLIFGKKYVQVELPLENKYEVSGEKLSKIKEMVDRGEVNEAENLLLDKIDYTNREDLAEAMFFYEYAGEKGGDFLKEHNYSQEEILDGLKRLAEAAGCEGALDMF